MSSCFFLDTEESKNDPGLSTFRHFKDALLDRVPKELILEKIRNERKATLGVFTVRQKFNPVTRSREGYGEWLGRLGKVVAKIEMMDNLVVRIHLSSFADNEFVSVSLRRLLDEMHLSHSSTNVSPNDLYLLARGKMLLSGTIPKMSSPLNYDPKLEFTILENIPKMNWKIRTTNFAIRMVVQDGPYSPELTLLSESISARDWRPELPCFSKSLDLFQNFTKTSQSQHIKCLTSFQSICLVHMN